jgi:hypothetical protein
METKIETLVVSTTKWIKTLEGIVLLSLLFGIERIITSVEFSTFF